MTNEQLALWHRIRDFSIDAPDASYPLSARLAREQGWTPVYAVRVLDEYRKFTFLSVVAGHGVTPSKAVDEAWHLHLLYTRNYWEDFCPNALGKPLHHNPANGTPDDDSKYEGWYENTLASYRSFFGEPPADIWLVSETPKRVSRRLFPWLAFGALTLAGCEPGLDPLDLPGPDFLAVYGAFYGIAIVFTLLLRQAMRMPIEGPPATDWQLNIYEEAFLNEGGTHALITALTRLTASGVLTVNHRNGRFTAESGAVGDLPLDKAILRAATTVKGSEFTTIHRVAKPTLVEMEDTLRRQGLWIDRTQGAWYSLVAGGILFAPVLLGTAKIFVGISRDRPVAFLMISCVIALVANVVLMIPPKRSRYGDRVLSELRVYKQSYRRAASLPSTAPNDRAAGMALFGAAVLVGTEYDYMRRMAQPISTGDSSSSSGCGSSSSCGSGSDGGGGSSCGGGCGGCGGD